MSDEKKLILVKDLLEKIIESKIQEKGIAEGTINFDDEMHNIKLGLESIEKVIKQNNLNENLYN